MEHWKEENRIKKGLTGEEEMGPIKNSYRGLIDQPRMLDLVRSRPQAHPHMVDLPYRLCSWALDDPENVGLWVDSHGQLQAWAVLQEPFWTIDYAINPKGDRTFLSQVLEWADRQAKELLKLPTGHPQWFVEVFADQVDKIRILEAARFQPQADVGEDSWSKVLMRRLGGSPVKEYRIPPGFTLRPLVGEGEVASYVELHQAVFETKNMTFEWRQHTLHHPNYSPDLDLVVAAPEGKLAAFCIGWLWQEPGKALIGQIEPLGCAVEFRRYAFGRVVLAEVLRRMEKLGVEAIYVETDNYRNTALALYESLGFQVERDILVFRKDY